MRSEDGVFMPCMGQWSWCGCFVMGYNLFFFSFSPFVCFSIHWALKKIPVVRSDDACMLAWDSGVGVGVLRWGKNLLCFLFVCFSFHWAKLPVMRPDDGACMHAWDSGVGVGVL